MQDHIFASPKFGGRHRFMQRRVVLDEQSLFWMGRNMAGQIKNEGTKKVFQNHSYFELCFRNECEWYLLSISG